MPKTTSIKYVSQVAMLLNKYFRKNNCSIYSQLKSSGGTDILIVNNKTKKIVRINVYYSTAGRSNSEYNYSCWFSNFINKYEEGITDFYIFISYNEKENIKELVLCYNDDDIKFLNKSKLKKSDKTDKFFYYKFNSPTEVYIDRGFLHLSKEERDHSKYVLKKRIKDIYSFLS